MRTHTEVILLSIWATVQANCPFEYSESDASERCYLLPNIAIPVPEYAVDQMCTTFLGNVIQPNNGDDNEYLSTVVKENDTYWIGLSDKAAEGEYKWRNGDALSYTNWAPEQPQNTEDTDCVIMDHLLQWKSVSCSESHKLFCQSVKEQRPTFGKFRDVESVLDKRATSSFTATCLEDCITACMNAAQCTGILFGVNNKACAQLVDSPGLGISYPVPGNRYYLMQTNA